VVADSAPRTREGEGQLAEVSTRSSSQGAATRTGPQVPGITSGVVPAGSRASPCMLGSIGNTSMAVEEAGRADPEEQEFLVLRVPLLALLAEVGGQPVMGDTHCCTSSSSARSFRGGSEYSQCRVSKRLAGHAVVEPAWVHAPAEAPIVETAHSLPMWATLP